MLLAGLLGRLLYFRGHTFQRDGDLEVLLPVLQRRLAGHFFKLLVEVRQGVKTGFVANLADVDRFFVQQLAGVVYPDLRQKIRE